MDAAVEQATGKTRYLVGGMLRPAVKQISEAMTKTKTTPSILQLAPICSFNAFEFAYPEIFKTKPFSSSTWDMSKARC